MIKLYFIRQLEDQDGIPTFPRLDKYCVEEAFKEMRKEGYEDDGLFHEMELFFQPLTVTEDELAINSALLTDIRSKELQKQTELNKKIEDFKIELEGKKPELEAQSKKFEELKIQRKEEVEVESKKPRPKNSQEQLIRDREWEEKHDAWNEIKVTYTKKIKDLDNRIKQIETSIAECETSLMEVEENLKNNKTKIDQKLVKPDRGFIMYGPPGNEKLCCFKDEN